MPNMFINTPPLIIITDMVKFSYRGRLWKPAFGRDNLHIKNTAVVTAVVVHVRQIGQAHVFFGLCVIGHKVTVDFQKKL